jgi:hypothetical protein
MDITTETRREVAENLLDRRATAGMDDRTFANEREVREWLEAQLFWVRTCIIPAARRTETWTFDQLLDALGALIKPDECEALPTDNGSFKCSACGWDGRMDEEAITNYCPECGAKVAR